MYFYKEYALIELEMGRFNNCINILETAIQSQACLSIITNVCEKAELFSVYRTFIETLLDVRETYDESHRQWILKIFGQMISSKDTNQDSLVEAYLCKQVQDFLQATPNENERDILFLSNLECDTIVCYAYFLYARDGDIRTAVETFKTCIDHCTGHPYLQVLT